MAQKLFVVADNCRRKKIGPIHINLLRPHAELQMQEQNQPHRPRAVLSYADVIEIFKCRKQNPTIRQSKSASELATIFKISPKTVRDIWNRRTWICETKPLWSAGDTPKLRTKNGRISFPDKPIASNPNDSPIGDFRNISHDKRQTQPDCCQEQLTSNETKKMHHFFSYTLLDAGLSHDNRIANQSQGRYAPQVPEHGHNNASFVTSKPTVKISSHCSAPLPLLLPDTTPQPEAQGTVAAAAWAFQGVCDTEDDPFRHDWPYW